MYIPRHFHETDPARLFALMEQHRFALLVTSEGGVPVATHLPLLVERDAARGDRLVGHMARANPQWRAFSEEREVLAIFEGPHAYVSPSWYAEQPSVPTWNFAAVHAYGRPRVLEDPAEVLRVLRASVDTFEAGFERP